MSGSEGSGGIAVLSAVIPDGIIADAASKINQDEVLAALSTNPTDGENRVYLEKSGDALELIYEHFKKVNKATLAQLLGLSVGAVEEHTPGKAIFVHRDNGRGFRWFGQQPGVLIVLIPIIQPTAVQDYKYIKDSHKKDAAKLSPTAEMITVPLGPGQIMVHNSGLVFKGTLKTGEICATFGYKLSADGG